MSGLDAPVCPKARGDLREAATQQVAKLVGDQVPVASWERAEFEAHGQLATRRHVNAYRARVAEIKAALKRLPHLGADLAAGKLHPEDLAAMHGTDLASEEARVLAEKQRSEYYTRHVLVPTTRDTEQSRRQELAYYKSLGHGPDGDGEEVSEEEEVALEPESGLDALMAGLTVQDDDWGSARRWSVPKADAVAHAPMPVKLESLEAAKLFQREVAPAVVAVASATMVEAAETPPVAPLAAAAAVAPKEVRTVAVLRAALKAKGLPTTGRKDELIRRLDDTENVENHVAALVSTDASEVLRVREKTVNLPAAAVSFRKGRLVLAAVGAGVNVNGQPLAKGGERPVAQFDVIGVDNREYEVMVEDAHRF